MPIMMMPCHVMQTKGVRQKGDKIVLIMYDTMSCHVMSGRVRESDSA